MISTRSTMKACNELTFGETYVNRENFEAMQGFHAGNRKFAIGGADGKHGLLEYTTTHICYIQNCRLRPHWSKTFGVFDRVAVKLAGWGYRMMYYAASSIARTRASASLIALAATVSITSRGEITGSSAAPGLEDRGMRHLNQGGVADESRFRQLAASAHDRGYGRHQQQTHVSNAAGVNPALVRSLHDPTIVSIFGDTRTQLTACPR
jgi:hypothetical protein